MNDKNDEKSPVEAFLNLILFDVIRFMSLLYCLITAQSGFIVKMPLVFYGRHPNAYLVINNGHISHNLLFNISIQCVHPYFTY